MFLYIVIKTAKCMILLVCVAAHHLNTMNVFAASFSTLE